MVLQDKGVAVRLHEAAEPKAVNAHQPNPPEIRLAFLRPF